MAVSIFPVPQFPSGVTKAAKAGDTIRSEKRPRTKKIEKVIILDFMDSLILTWVKLEGDEVENSIDFCVAFEFFCRLGLGGNKL